MARTPEPTPTPRRPVPLPGVDPTPNIASGSDGDGLGPGYDLIGTPAPVVPPGRMAPGVQPPDRLTITNSQGVNALPPEDMMRLKVRLHSVGLLPADYQFTEFLDEETVDALHDLRSLAKQNDMADLDMLFALQRSTGASRAERAGESSDGLGRVAAGEQRAKQVSTNTSVQSYSRLDAEHIAESAFQEALGEDPTPRQVAALRKALNSYAKANPSVSTTTTRYKGSDARSSTTTSAGMDATAATEIAEDFAQAQPNYAETQAATTYFNALLSALGPTADVSAP